MILMNLRVTLGFCKGISLSEVFKYKRSEYIIYSQMVQGKQIDNASTAS